MQNNLILNLDNNENIVKNYFRIKEIITYYNDFISISFFAFATILIFISAFLFSFDIYNITNFLLLFLATFLLTSLVQKFSIFIAIKNQSPSLVFNNLKDVENAIKSIYIENTFKQNIEEIIMNSNDIKDIEEKLFILSYDENIDNMAILLNSINNTIKTNFVRV